MATHAVSPVTGCFKMPKLGQAHHHAKLSDEDVLDMREKRETRPWLWSYHALAKHFGCGMSTVRDIVTYKTRYNVNKKD